MGKYKDKHGETLFNNFLGKAKTVIPEVINIAGSAVSGNYIGAIKQVGDLLTQKAKDNPQAKELLEEFNRDRATFELEAYKLESEDRQGARNLYKENDIIQKIIACIFLFCYGFLSVYLLQTLTGNIQLPKLAETMITMIWTGTSAKLNTIIDFFFGGSVKR